MARAAVGGKGNRFGIIGKAQNPTVTKTTWIGDLIAKILHNIEPKQCDSLNQKILCSDAKGEIAWQREALNRTESSKSRNRIQENGIADGGGRINGPLCRISQSLVQ